MESQRISLANMPRFLDETLKRALADMTGLRIAAEVADWAMLPSVSQQISAQWVIVAPRSGHETSQAADLLLAAHPAIRLLNAATDGGHITLQWFEPHEQTIDNFSMRELVALLTSQLPAGMPAH